MPTTHRPYTDSDADLNLVMTLLNTVSFHPELDNNWDPGRHDFWRGSVGGDKPQSWFEENAHIWLAEDDRAIGLFISEYGGDDCFVVAHPEHPDLLPEIIAWGRAVWAAERKEMITFIFTHDASKVTALEQAGFVQVRKESNVRTYDMQGYDFSYTLKEGFTMATFTDYGNYAGRVALVQNAFDNPNYNETRLRALQSSPNYQPDLDLMVLSPEGQPAGYCMGWVNERDSSGGYLEPMGVHSDYRRNGFGSALAKECFKRLHTKGVRWVEIASGVEPNISNFLYDSLNPVKKISAWEYVLDLG